MAIHLFGTVLTSRAVAGNNRGENEGNVSTLQKIIRNGDLYTTVSGEAIRYALREVWQLDGTDDLNRVVSHTGSEWKDTNFGRQFKLKKTKKGDKSGSAESPSPAEAADKAKLLPAETYVDNDVLGFMNPSEETHSRRGVLEISRAVSTLPWAGTISPHFASVGAHPNKNVNPIPYSVEIHDTRYQFTFAMTPQALLRDRLNRVEKTLYAIRDLRRVGGAHARFLYDFAPEMIVLRITHDPAPRIMNCFMENEQGDLSLAPLLRRLRADEGDEPDVKPDELIFGGVPDELIPRKKADDSKPDPAKLPHDLPVVVKPGVKAAVSAAVQKLRSMGVE